jgi:dUTP pyrophosphatase
MINVSFTYLPDADRDVPLPAYATLGAAGADIRANLLPADRAAGLNLAPMARVLVPTGLACAIPDGYEMQIRARSGLALKHGLTLPNAPATIDSDYRGPLGVILQNLSDAPFTIEHGMRIAQIVISPVVQAQFVETKVLPDTARGAGGYGSTGVR